MLAMTKTMPDTASERYTNTLLECAKEGVLAASDGCTEINCPYESGTRESQFWLYGLRKYLTDNK
jgi:ribosome modulation factor